MRLTAAALCALLAAACSDNATSPSLVEPGSLNAKKGLPLVGGILASTGHLVSNKTKYSNSSTGSNATGRSGTAKLAASAIVATDGRAWLTVTTGDLEALAAAPGAIVHLQVKITGPDGDKLATLNFQDPGGLGGTGSLGSLILQLDGVPPGSTFRLQGNVRGIDGRRTDVVTVSGGFGLAAAIEARIHAPDEAVVNTPTVITGTVTELNGQVGSRADCVLYVDGVRVDVADGIWVDAGDAVTCAFTHTFTETGGHDVEIRLEDPSTGTTIIVGSFSSDTVQVIDPVSTSWTISAEERTVASSNWHWYDWLNPVTGARKDYSDFDIRQERTQTVAVTGMLTRNTSFPVAVVRVRYGSGGLTWDNDEWTGLVVTTGLNGAQCINRQVSPLGALFYLCSSGGNTSFGYSRFGGIVTYHSDGFSRTFDGAGVEDVFTWNDSYIEYQQGEQVRPWGNDVWMKISITDVLGTFTIDPVAQLTTRESTVQPRTESCEDTFPWWLDGGRIHACFASEVRESVRSGEGAG
ncbi:MAG TPA: hypothetical protein VFX98_11970 [Longimicrobiaceae bacterium]|nr:hypothetical protein [Longimicrobiaceae bacterium]